MSEPIHRVLESLPSSSMTTRALGALDYLVPGEWQNVTNFEAMIKHVTGEEDQALIQRIGERAVAVYDDSSTGYARAVDVYRVVDDVSTVAGVAALANKLGEHVEFLGFLDKVTPKADTTQSIDAAVKFAAELSAFCLCNGMPGDSFSDFATSLAAYEKEDAIRFAAWIAFDCVIPLGPDFLSKVTEKLASASESELGEHGRFAKVAEYLPGSVLEKRDFLVRNIESSRASIDAFIASKGVTREGLLERIKGPLEIADDKLDFVAAALDMTTNYFWHTGVQSVARRLISRAYGEI